MNELVLNMFSPRAVKVIIEAALKYTPKASHIDVVGVLRSLTAEQLLAVRQCGANTLNEIRRVAAYHHINLQDDPPTVVDVDMLNGRLRVQRGQCPYCKSQHVVTSDYYDNPDGVRCIALCTVCKETWVEAYQFQKASFTE